MASYLPLNLCPVLCLLFYYYGWTPIQSHVLQFPLYFYIPSANFLYIFFVIILLIFLYKGRQLAPTSSETTIILSLLDRTYNPVLFSPIFILNSISFEPMDCSCYTPVIFFFFYRKISSKLLPRTNFSPFIFIEFTPIKLLLIPPHRNI